MAKSKGTKSETKTNDTPLIATPAGSQMRIPVEMIVADDDFNARKVLGGRTEEGHTIESLAKTIEVEGQLSPVMVADAEQVLGEKYRGKWYLIAGFRRFYAISWPKDKGGLGQKTILASIYQPTDAKGNPTPIDIVELKYVNLIENEARKNLNPYERAVRYHDLVKNHEDKGAQIAKRVSLDPSYVNRLVAAMEMHPKLIERFKLEHSPDYDGSRLLTTDQLNKLTHMRVKDKDGKNTEKQDWDAQVKWLESMLAPKPETDDEGDEDGEGGDDKDDAAVKRTSMSQIKRAIVAAELAKKNVKKTDDVARLEGIIEALKFAIKPRKIEGVLSLKDGGKVIVGPDGKHVSAPKS